MDWDARALIAAMVVGAILWTMWVAERRRYAFLIRLRDGQPCLVRGTVTPAFLDDVRNISREAGVRAGWVGGVRQGQRKMRLIFSSSFPNPFRQRLRNTWEIVG